LNAARRGAAVFVVVAAWTKVSLASPNDGVDQRKSPSRQARIGAPVRLVLLFRSGLNQAGG
jgi:hypothetical protein